MPITSEFVAEARARYVPAIRWARANGWDTPRLRNADRSIEIHISEAWNDGSPVPTFLVLRKASALREQFYPTSVRQAIDYLVTAGALPVQFHSLSVQIERLKAANANLISHAEILADELVLSNAVLS